MFAKVIVTVKHKKIDRIYTYSIPNDLIDIQVGMRCIVPFGKGDKELIAYIVELAEEIDFDVKKCKSIIRMIDKKPVLTEQQISVAMQMHKQLYCTMVECIKLFVPRGMHIQNEYVVSANVDYIDKFEFNTSEKKIINYLIENGNNIVFEQLLENFPTGKEKVYELKKIGAVQLKNVSEFKDLSQKICYVSLNYENDNIEDMIYDIIKAKNKQSKVIELLLETEKMSKKSIMDILSITGSPINTLVKKGVVVINDEVVIRNPILEYVEAKSKVKQYTVDQQKAIDFISNEVDNEKYTKPILLHGVTGSGKTEIYINIIQKVLSKGKSAIVLVPEISLTGQIVDIFMSRFKDLVSVTHSKLSNGERYDNYKRVKNGEVKIMIGARSAIFTPFDNIGAIIIDEEHDSSFRSDVTPKYSASEVAKIVAKEHDAALIFGSATPKIETYYNALNGEYHILELSNRVNKNLPDIEVVDLREELKQGNKSIFSSALLEKMVEAINKDEQIILFINKRGYSSFVNCRSCGEVIKCEDCDVSMTYHRYNNKLHCHYCNKTKHNPKNCPVCGSKYIKHFGIGTQQVEDEIKKIFPSEEVIRMDADTTSTKNAHAKLVRDFRAKKARFLVGTQMIAKGLDFDDVTVVGVIASDMSLNANEYKASETTFSLISQVAGRAGRSEKKGNVVVQSYKPEHYAIQMAKENDYKGFYQSEITFREISLNPPFSNLFFVYATCENEKKLILTLYKLCDFMLQYKSTLDTSNRFEYNFFEVIGPAPQVVSKMRKRYRWRILMKSDNKEMVTHIAEYCTMKIKDEMNITDVNISLSLNPENIN